MPAVDNYFETFYIAKRNFIRIRRSHCMRSPFLKLAVPVLVLATISSAQTSRFSPDDQQIPVPECLAIKGLWEGGSKPCLPISRTGGWNAAYGSATTASGTICPL